MSIEAMKQALEALEECRRDPRLKYEHPFYDKTIISLRTAIAEAEKQEPVAWQGVHDQTDLYYRKPPQADVRPLYTTPPAAQRQWVGLTDKERDEICLGDEGIARAIEAKLKEKNT